MSTTKIIQVADGFIWAPVALTGNQLSPEENVLLEIRKGMIVSLQAKVGLKSLAREVKTSLYELSPGTTLLPSLIDAHVHLALSGSNPIEAPALFEDRADFRQRIEENLMCHLKSGIGAVRDGGDRCGVNLNAKKELCKSKKIHPQIIATGEALRKHNNYGTFLGQSYTEKNEIEPFIMKQKQFGIDQLKVIASGIVDFNTYGRVSGFILPLDELTYIISCAHERKLKVMVHASSAEAVEVAVQAGADSIEHGYFITREILKKLADQNIAWLPTIIPVAVQLRGLQRRTWKKEQLDIIMKTCEKQMEKVATASQLGVCLGVGTDSGASAVKHGISLAEEIFLYSESGLDNSSILKSATVVNARILGLEKQMGLIDPGYKAHLIAVRGNPLSDLSVLKNIELHFLPF